jgi:hypothetical protein
MVRVLTYSICWVDEGIVNGNDVNLVMLNSISEDNTSNTTKAVDSNLDWSHIAAKVSVRLSMRALKLSIFLCNEGHHFVCEKPRTPQKHWPLNDM